MPKFIFLPPLYALGVLSLFVVLKVNINNRWHNFFLTFPVSPFLLRFWNIYFCCFFRNFLCFSLLSWCFPPLWLLLFLRLLRSGCSGVSPLPLDSDGVSGSSCKGSICLECGQIIGLKWKLLGRKLYLLLISEGDRAGVVR